RVLTMRIATRTLFGEDIGERGRRIGPLLQRAFNALAHPLSRLWLCQVKGNDLGCLPNSGTIPHYYMEIERQQHTQWAIIYFMWGSF
ncbi:MAG: hypothetical protein ACREXM_19820, partial [Gammaproteobacteria bacterium]